MNDEAKVVHPVASVQLSGTQPRSRLAAARESYAAGGPEARPIVHGGKGPRRATDEPGPHMTGGSI